MHFGTNPWTYWNIFSNMSWWKPWCKNWPFFSLDLKDCQQKNLMFNVAFWILKLFLTFSYFHSFIINNVCKWNILYSVFVKKYAFSLPFKPLVKKLGNSFISLTYLIFLITSFLLLWRPSLKLKNTLENSWKKNPLIKI